MLKDLLLKNVLLETGFETLNAFGYVKTKTERKDILIQEGIITEIDNVINGSKDIETLDAAGQLILPALREMHIHIDKTYYGGPWRSGKPAEHGIFTRISEEERLLPELLPFVEERAEKILDLLISQGHTHVRTHCNIDPSIGLKNLEKIVKVLEKYKDKLTYDIVAFPQHGLLRSNVESLVREAMKLGATLVGGVDPATLDDNIEKSLDVMFDIAIEANAGIDIHHHESDTLGSFTLHKIAEKTKEAGLEGRVTISHALALADLDSQELENLMYELKTAKIDLATSVPVSHSTIPILTLDKYGIPVSVGHDSLIDHWSPFGNGNTIEKLSVLGERFRVLDEVGISQLWKFGSGGVTPLSERGDQLWPKVGDQADLVLVDAVCSAQAIARRRPITTTVHKGQVTFNHKKSQEGGL